MKRDDIYTASKSTETFPVVFKFNKKFKNDIISENHTTADSRRKYGEKLIKTVCDAFNVPVIDLKVKDLNQPHRDRNGKLSRKTLGQYTFCRSTGRNIVIWNNTAKLGKTVSGKTFFNTLIHELCHHLDITLFKFSDSPHTSGFYKRISHLESMFE